MTDSPVATTDMAAEASATAEEVVATVEATTVADIMVEATTVADITAADTTAEDTMVEVNLAEEQLLAAAAHVPLLEQMAAVIADSEAAVPHATPFLATPLPRAATPLPHSVPQ